MSVIHTQNQSQIFLKVDVTLKEKTLAKVKKV